jgi:hypothetical protein
MVVGEGKGRRARGARDARKNATRSREPVTSLFSISLHARLHLHSSSVSSFIGFLRHPVRIAYHSMPLSFTASPARISLNNTHTQLTALGGGRSRPLHDWPPSCTP